MKLDRNGLHFPECPRFDRWSDEHPWRCVALLVGCFALVCLAGAGVWLMITVWK